MFAVVFWAGTLLGQRSVRPVDDHDSDLLEKRMKMREEMHRRMMNKLLHGIGPDQDMFSDMEEMMNEIMSDSSGGFSSFSSGSSANFKMEWKDSSLGRTLEITPSDPKQNLDINVSNGLIIIKGKVESKSANGVSISNFSNSFNVPEDCDPAKVKMDQRDGKIFVHFPFRAAKSSLPKPKDDRRPLPPSGEDVQI
jgi:HSP20 family molecular chaperone IbpA